MARYPNIRDHGLIGDRAIRLARDRGWPDDIPRWAAERDAVYRQVTERGQNPEIGAFTLHYDTKVLDDARLTFEKMHTYANHLGLYSEEIGSTGGQLGNVPQAFSLLSLISAAVNLDRHLNDTAGPGRQ